MKGVSAEPMDEHNNDFLNRKVEILLKNGNRIQGIVIGYFKKDMDDLNSPVIKWHIINNKDKMTLGIDAFGFLIGKIIEQKDIEGMKFKD